MRAVRASSARGSEHGLAGVDARLERRHHSSQSPKMSTARYAKRPVEFSACPWREGILLFPMARASVADLVAYAEEARLSALGKAECLWSRGRLALHAEVRQGAFLSIRQFGKTTERAFGAVGKARMPSPQRARPSPNVSVGLEPMANVRGNRMANGMSEERLARIAGHHRPLRGRGTVPGRGLPYLARRRGDVLPRNGPAGTWNGKCR